MSLPRATGSYAWLSADSRGATAAVEEMLKLLGKASRAHQLYLANNPTYHRALELLRASLASVWEQLPEVVLAVTENALLLDDRPVFQEAERASDTLPWLLYKDGVRELRLLPGFEDQEVEALLAVLGQLRRAAASEDDAITLLWERDFSFLRYRYVESSGDDELAGFPTADSPGRLSGAAAEPEAPERRPAGVVSLQDFDGTLHFLAEHELAYLREALALEYAHDLRVDVVNQLLDILELVPARQARDEACSALEELLLQSLTAGDYRAAAHLLRETAVSAGRAPALEDGHRARLQRLAEQLSTPEVLGQLLETLESSPALPADSELHELLGQLRPAALATIFRWIDRVQSTRLRSALRAAGDRLALESSAELVRLISSDELAVAREAVSRSGELRAQGAVAALSALLRRDDRTLRVLAAQALAAISTPGALQTLGELVDADDREIRLAALRAIGVHGYRGALARVDALVRGKRLRERDLTEQMAAFEAYGALSGDDGVALLDGLLNGRSVLGRRADSTVRACAAVALGRIGSDRAAESLARASGEKEAVVRTAVQRAMRGPR